MAKKKAAPKKTKTPKDPVLESLVRPSIEVSGLVCMKCHTFVYSRARHDFRQCRCKEDAATYVYVDGGFDYMRYGAAGAAVFYPAKFTLYATKQELYDDWNGYGEKYGRIALDGTETDPA